MDPPAEFCLKGGVGGLWGGPPSGDPELLENIFWPKLTCAEGARENFAWPKARRKFWPHHLRGGGGIRGEGEGVLDPPSPHPIPTPQEMLSC